MNVHMAEMKVLLMETGVSKPQNIEKLREYLKDYSPVIQKVL
jgi:hypothetical protein